MRFGVFPKTAKILLTNITKMRIRKFKIDNGNAVMCEENDYCGEFVHINDIRLFLMEKKQYLENNAEQYNPENNKGKESAWLKEQYTRCEAKIDLINELKNEMK